MLELHCTDRSEFEAEFADAETRQTRLAQSLTRGPIPTRAVEAVMARAEADLERRLAALRKPLRLV